MGLGVRIPLGAPNNAGLAQLVERVIEAHCVGGSIPSVSTKQLRGGEVETRYPHKVKIAGANPAPATKQCSGH